MIDLSTDPELRIREFVRQWFKLLAAGKLDEACAQIDEPTGDDAWTSAGILSILHSTFSPETYFYQVHPEGPLFTDPDELKPDPYEDPFDASDGDWYMFEPQVPLNHEHSDLTAKFRFERRENGHAVVLHDLHVM